VSSAALPASSTPAPSSPSILGRVMRGTFWLALKLPVQVLIGLWSISLTQKYIGQDANGAYLFAWGFGFIQFVLEFGMGSALQKQMVDVYTRGDRDGVNRTIACGMNFYAGVALVQMLILGVIAQCGLLPAKFQGNQLVLGVIWVQILATPFFGISTVVGSVLQAARRYEFIPRLEMAIVLGRFGLLWLGYWTGADFLMIVAGQVALQIGLSLGPALWVMVKDLGYRPHFGGATWADYAPMMHISLYMALLQWSVVMADKVDTTVLGYALRDPDPLFLITAYQNVSKPFLQIRQMGWTLAYLVMPAVVSLAVGGDRRGLERIKYDGTRILVALLAPVTLLAGIYAAPFLSLWVGPEFVPYAWMLQLFLVATLPLVLSVVVQMAIGMGKIEVVAISNLVGALINLPLSYFLTRRLGVSGVIWGTVLTTLFSNLLVPGVYVFRVLDIKYSTFFARTLGAPLGGALALVVACLGFQAVVPPGPSEATSGLARALPFLANLGVGTLAYLVGYFAVPVGRGDASALLRKFGRRGPVDG
jgi:O-antigen/teichoic acid export membrane protein